MGMAYDELDEKFAALESFMAQQMAEAHEHTGMFAVRANELKASPIKEDI